MNKFLLIVAQVVVGVIMGVGLSAIMLVLIG